MAKEEKKLINPMRKKSHEDLIGIIEHHYSDENAAGRAEAEDEVGILSEKYKSTWRNMYKDDGGNLKIKTDMNEDDIEHMVNKILMEGISYHNKKAGEMVAEHPEYIQTYARAFLNINAHEFIDSLKQSTKPDEIKGILDQLSESVAKSSATKRKHLNDAIRELGDIRHYDKNKKFSKSKLTGLGYEIVDEHDPEVIHRYTIAAASDKLDSDYLHRHTEGGKLKRYDKAA